MDERQLEAQSRLLIELGEPETWLETMLRASKRSTSHAFDQGDRELAKRWRKLTRGLEYAVAATVNDPIADKDQPPSGLEPMDADATIERERLAARLDPNQTSLIQSQRSAFQPAHHEPTQAESDAAQAQSQDAHLRRYYAERNVELPSNVAKGNKSNKGADTPQPDNPLP